MDTQPRARGFVGRVAIAVVVAVSVILLLLLLRGRPQPARPSESGLAACISNIKLIYAALKEYEAEHGQLPVHYANCPKRHWIVQIDPYLPGADRSIFLCPDDPTLGERGNWGLNIKSSYCYYYTQPHLGAGGKYRRPSARSPLVGCAAHEGYQDIMGRYDGTVELAPARRYPQITVEFDP